MNYFFDRNRQASSKFEEILQKNHHFSLNDVQKVNPDQIKRGEGLEKPTPNRLSLKIM